MPILGPGGLSNLSISRGQIGIFVSGIVGGLLFGWVIRGRQMKKLLQIRTTKSITSGTPSLKSGALMAANRASRKSNAHGDLEWTDTSEGETDETPSSARSRSKTKIPLRDCKMVLLVRMDLEMGKGKMAAQCAHAAIGAYEEATQRRDRFLKPWQKYGQTKIALKVPDEATLVSLAQQAQHSGLNTYVVRDAGRTQIAAGSLTVAAIGPGPVEAVDKITGHLKLL